MFKIYTLGFEDKGVVTKDFIIVNFESRLESFQDDSVTESSIENLIEELQHRSELVFGEESGICKFKGEFTLYRPFSQSEKINLITMMNKQVKKKKV